MKVKIKLFATLRDYLPKDSIDYTIEVNVEEGTTIAEIFNKESIPLPHISLVNGIHKPVDTPLPMSDEEILISAFPPIAGG